MCLWEPFSATSRMDWKLEEDVAIEDNKVGGGSGRENQTFNTAGKSG